MDRLTSWPSFFVASPPPDFTSRITGSTVHWCHCHVIQTPSKNIVASIVVEIRVKDRGTGKKIESYYRSLNSWNHVRPRHTHHTHVFMNNINISHPSDYLALVFVCPKQHWMSIEQHQREQEEAQWPVFLQLIVSRCKPVLKNQRQQHACISYSLVALVSTQENLKIVPQLSVCGTEECEKLGERF